MFERSVSAALRLPRALVRMLGEGYRIAHEAGAVSTEYGLILMLIALAIIVAAGAFGLAVSGLFTRASGSFPAS